MNTINSHFECLKPFFDGFRSTYLSRQLSLIRRDKSNTYSRRREIRPLRGRVSPLVDTRMLSWIGAMSSRQLEIKNQFLTKHPRLAVSEA